MREWEKRMMLRWDWFRCALFRNVSQERDRLGRAERKTRAAYAVNVLCHDVRRNKQREALKLSGRIVESHRLSRAGRGWGRVF